MLISESWLREWVSPKATAQELGEKLTLSGSEMDSVTRAGPDLNNSKIVVGHILSVAPHPDATKLQICDVDVGKKKPLSIICGAPNACAGLKTAVATNGAKLPGLTVGNREIRGVKSFGMLCSNAELGIDESAEGIVEFDLKAPVGVGVAEYLDLADSVIELELTPNRGDFFVFSGIAL
jgi:phenylalanyl-tRNA synthetase beta chain